MQIEKIVSKKAGVAPKYRCRIQDRSLRRKVTVGTFPSSALAKAAGHAAEVEMLTQGFLAVPLDCAFGTAVDDFLGTLGARALTTRNWYRYALKPARTYFGEGSSIRRVTKVKVQQYGQSLVKRGLAPTTVRGHVKAVSILMGYAIEAGYRTDNPALKLRGLPEKKRLEGSVRAVTPAEHKRLVEAVPTEFHHGRGMLHFRGYQVMVEVMPYLGLRRSEIQGLCWDAVELSSATLQVQVQLRDDGTLDPALKTPKSFRTVRIPGKIVRLLREWKAESPSNRLNLVFPSQRGEPQNKGQFYRIWHKSCLAAGLVGLDPHDLRHTFATWNLAAGCNPKWVADQMGHAKPSMMLDIYAHLLPSADADAEKKRNAWHAEQSFSEVCAPMAPQEENIAV